MVSGHAAHLWPLFPAFPSEAADRCEEKPDHHGAAGWMGLVDALRRHDLNIKPVMDPEGGSISLGGFVQSVAAMAFMGGVLAKQFLKSFAQHAPFPQRDPRIAETMGVYVELESEAEAKTQSAEA